MLVHSGWQDLETAELALRMLQPRSSLATACSPLAYDAHAALKRWVCCCLSPRLTVFQCNSTCVHAGAATALHDARRD